MLPKTRVNDGHPFAAPQLNPSRATQSTHRSPGYMGTNPNLPPESSFGEKTHFTLRAPRRRKSLTTCFQAWR